LIYNVFRFLFEEEHCLSFPVEEFDLCKSVYKTHRVLTIKAVKEKEENILYVIPVRDPIQATISRCRIRSYPVKNIRTFCKNMINGYVTFFQCVEDLQEAGFPVVILKFEEIEKGQCRYLIDFIQTHFHLSIEEKDAQTLSAGFSRENIYDNIRSFSSFNEFLPISGFRGKHISLEPFIPPDELLYWLNYYSNEVKPLFQKYGYATDS
jgi:hypothetical protein